MLRSGKEPPQFEDFGTIVRARLPGGAGNDAFARFVNVLPDALNRDVDVLLALAWLRRRRTLTATQLAGVIQRSIPEALSVLRRLAEVGILEGSRRTAMRATPTYHLRSETIALMSSAVAYGRHGADEVDKKVIDHVREYGFVTSRTIQRLFDIGVPSARNALADMRSRGCSKRSGTRGAAGGSGTARVPTFQSSHSTRRSARALGTVESWARPPVLLRPLIRAGRQAAGASLYGIWSYMPNT